MCIHITMPDSQHSNIIHQNNQKTPFNREDSKYFIHTQHQTNAEPQRRRNFCFLPNRALELITVIQKHNILQRFHLVAGCWLLRETLHSESLLVLEINEWFGYTYQRSQKCLAKLSHTHTHTHMRMPMEENAYEQKMYSNILLRNTTTDCDATERCFWVKWYKTKQHWLCVFTATNIGNSLDVLYYSMQTRRIIWYDYKALVFVVRHFG